MLNWFIIKRAVAGPIKDSLDGINTQYQPYMSASPNVKISKITTKHVYFSKCYTTVHVCFCAQKRFVVFTRLSQELSSPWDARELSEHAGGVAVEQWFHGGTSYIPRVALYKPSYSLPTDFSTLYKALKCLYVSLVPVLFQSSVLHCVILDLPPIPRLSYPQPLPRPRTNTTNTSWYEGTDDRFCLSNFQAISFSIQCIEKKKNSLCFNIAKNLVTNSDTIQRKIR